MPRVRPVTVSSRLRFTWARSPNASGTYSATITSLDPSRSTARSPWLGGSDRSTMFVPVTLVYQTGRTRKRAVSLPDALTASRAAWR